MCAFYLVYDIMHTLEQDTYVCIFVAVAYDVMHTFEQDTSVSIAVVRYPFSSVPSNGHLLVTLDC